MGTGRSSLGLCLLLTSRAGVCKLASHLTPLLEGLSLAVSASPAYPCHLCKYFQHARRVVLHDNHGINQVQHTIANSD